MKIAVAGKGGAGKTSVAGTLARELSQAGHSVLALDADTNPMLGISLGVGPEETYRLLAVRQGLDDGTVEHQDSVEAMIDTFGTDAPDGVRLVVALRDALVDPGCACCGMTAQQLLGELDDARRIVICDMEAGLGAVVRTGKSQVVLVVVEPSVKSIDVGVRIAAATADEVEVIVVANRVRDEADLEAIRAALGDYEIVVVPEDPAIARADRDGRAPLDVDSGGPGVTAISRLAERLAGQPARA